MVFKLYFYLPKYAVIDHKKITPPSHISKEPSRLGISKSIFMNIALSLHDDLIITHSDRTTKNKREYICDPILTVTLITERSTSNEQRVE